jgi:hypothetical protein
MLRAKALAVSILQKRPSMYSSSLAANVLGMQFIRRFAFWLHRVARWPQRTPPEYRAILRGLKRDGYYLVPDFLSPEAHERVEAEYRRLAPEFVEDHSAVRLPRVTGMSLHDRRMDREVANLLLEHPLFPTVARAFLNRVYHFPLQAFFTRISCDQDELTLPKNGGTNNLHFDAPTRVLKFFYLVTDTTEAHGPLTYCTGSNRRSLKHYLLEYKLSVRYAKNRGNVMHSGEYRDGDPWVKISPEEMTAAGLSETPIVGRANTLIIADVGGFHRRGVFRTAGERNTIEINYRGIECLRNDLYPLEERLRAFFGRTRDAATLIPATEAQ